MRLSRKKPRNLLLGIADWIWKEVILHRDRICQRCKSKGITRAASQPHHIWSRTHASTRHDPANGIGLCGGCHMFAHTEPFLFRDFLTRWMGQERFDALQMAAQTVQKSKDLKMVILALAARLPQTQKVRDAIVTASRS